MTDNELWEKIGSLIRLSWTEGYDVKRVSREIERLCHSFAISELERLKDDLYPDTDADGRAGIQTDVDSIWQIIDQAVSRLRERKEEK